MGIFLHDRFEPLIDSRFSIMDFLSRPYQRHEYGPIVSIQDAQNHFRLGNVSLELPKIPFGTPCSLCLIEDNHVFERRALFLVVIVTTSKHVYVLNLGFYCATNVSS